MARYGSFHTLSLLKPLELSVDTTSSSKGLKLGSTPRLAKLHVENTAKPINKTKPFS
jgi:hypothetical protein